jgi:hypothetical protein
MKTLLSAFLALLLSGCERHEAIQGLAGTYRTVDPLTRDRNPPAYVEVQFLPGQKVDIYSVDSSGRLGSVPALLQNYRIEQDRIIFSLPDVSEPILYDPLDLRILNSETLLWLPSKMKLKRN